MRSMRRKASCGLCLVGLAGGFVNGLLGVGGGMLFIPGLVYLGGLDEYHAHGSSLLIVLPVSMVSAVVYLLRGQVEWSLALKIALGGVIGAYIGARLTRSVPGRWLRYALAVTMVLAGTGMIL